MRLATWNINSVRIRLETIKDFIIRYSPDILCFQEIKTEDQFFPTNFFNDLGFNHQSVRGQKSYHGVAILSRIPIEISNSLSFVNDQARHLSVRLKNSIELHNFYFPSGGDIANPMINSKFEDKLNYVEDVTRWLNKNRSKNDKIILVGDLNIAPGVHDVWSHKQLIDVVSHTYMEIYAMNKLLNSINLIDAVRHFVPESEKLYSWWSYRNQNWHTNNKGRRLDHIFVTESLKTCLESFMIIKDMRNFISTSDHVPVMVDINC
jgi:exodeoxyribonuclease III